MSVRPHFEVAHDVWFDDLDAFGVVHNARYLLLFERTLGAFWAHLGFGGFFSDPDRIHVVRANQVDYLRPQVGIGTIRVRLSVSRLGTSSLTNGFEAWSTGEALLATGSRTVVRIDGDTWEVTPWAAAFRDALRPWLEEG